MTVCRWHGYEALRRTAGLVTESYEALRRTAGLVAESYVGSFTTPSVYNTIVGLTSTTHEHNGDF